PGVTAWNRTCQMPAVKDEGWLLMHQPENMRNFLLIASFIILIPASHMALAQSTFGTILGNVRDSSGALMPGCVVTIENTGTSVRRSTLSDEAGSYTVPNLEPGVYKVSIELPG